MLDAYAEISENFAFGVEICDASGRTLAILRFAPDGDAGYRGTNTLASGVSAGKAIITPVGENSLAFAYTVIFDTEDTRTAAYYNVEFGYRFFFEVNGLRHNAEWMTSDTFGDTVSAADAYRYFYKNGFADDSVVTSVMAELGELPEPETAYTRDGDTIYFGEYPQSKVTDSGLQDTLTAKAGTLPTSADAQAWTSYGYYENGSVSNYMWYIDVTEDGARYRGVYFTSYRPYWPSYSSSSSSNTYQDDNGYATGTVYWFKYEPIAWTVLSEGDGKAMLLCNMIIDSQQYDYEDGTYSNNYAESTIRAWLNDEFYNTAFNDLQRSIILTTTVDNSAESTVHSSNPYACEDTEDKMFLLSYAEVTNSAYGFASSAGTYDAARQKQPTDYAQAQGAYTHSGGSYDGNGYWWLRSPFNYYSNSANGVYIDSDASRNASAYTTYLGIVPALRITLH